MSEEIKEVIEALPKTNNTISAYRSIDINELYKTIEKFKKVPDYKELMKDNNNLQQRVEQLEKENKELKEVSGYFSREDLSNGTYTLDYSQYNFQTSITSITGYDASKTQILKNVNGTLTWVDES